MSAPIIGPCWAIPTEVAVALACPKDAARIVRVRLRSGQFRPHAILHVREAGFIADLTFEEPKYPGRAQAMAVVLSMPAQENAL